ncbi:hypothetical protein DN395_00530 [Bacillus sp. AR18-7]|nr:hypothetical protein DN395_00530 [Bacillus sp. AR18-7]
MLIFNPLISTLKDYSMMNFISKLMKTSSCMMSLLNDENVLSFFCYHIFSTFFLCFQLFT